MNIFIIDFHFGTLKGMAFLHGRNRIHRDLKSLNVFVTGNFSIKVIYYYDLSRTLPSSPSLTWASIGIVPVFILVSLLILSLFRLAISEP